MNASLSPTSAPRSALPPVPRLGRRGGPWIYSLTGVCFLFGALLAAQLRAVQEVRANNEERVKTDQFVAQRQTELARKYQAEKQRSNQLQVKLHDLKVTLSNSDLGSRQKIAALTASITELQAAAGMTEMTGPGVVLTVNDSPNASALVDASGFGPGSVHDFDLQQIVNELRANKAEAISINGTRVTGYTPIRCVGPSIQINWNATAPPYRIEAVGDARVLEAGLNLPGGIVDNLRKNTLAIKVTRASRLTLPAAESLPRLRSAQTTGTRLSANSTDDGQHDRDTR